MKRILCYVMALLRRHLVSFLLACIVPAVAGLIAVAAATEIGNIKYSQYLAADEYVDTVCFNQYEIANNDGFSWGYHGGYSYPANSEIAKEIETYPIVAKYSIVQIVCPDGAFNVTMIDYDYWLNFPVRIYKGKGFSGECNEALLDVSKMKYYKIGDVYSFEYLNTKGEVVGSVEAKVIGFTRYNRYDKSSPNGMICMPGGWNDINGLDCVYRKVPVERMEELFPPPVYSVGLIKRDYAPTAEEINKYAIALFFFAILAILCIVSDLCFNGSMLSRIERVSVRGGMQYKELSVSYILKALLQLAVSTLIMTVVILFFNRRTGSLLIMESLWAGVVVVLIMVLISWAFDCLRLYRSSRK